MGTMQTKPISILCLASTVMCVAMWVHMPMGTFFVFVHMGVLLVQVLA